MLLGEDTYKKFMTPEMKKYWINKKITENVKNINKIKKVKKIV